MVEGSRLEVLTAIYDVGRQVRSEPTYLRGTLSVRPNFMTE